VNVVLTRGQPPEARGGSATDRAESAAGSIARWLRERGVGDPRGVFVFGSGWSPLVGRVEALGRWSYRDVPGLPPTSVTGHPGDLVWCRWRGLPCLLFVGRWHMYEGRTPAEVALPSTVAAALGSRWLFCTNAAGGVAPHLQIGQLVGLTDDIALWSARWLALHGDVPWYHRLDDLSNTSSASAVYSASLLAALFDAARSTNVPLERGVLAMMPGPNYETAAEIGMVRAAGADLVSMSTVLEARCARLLGLEVAALSCVTNRAPARPGSPLAHDEVLTILDATLDDAGRLLDAWLDDARVREGL